MPVKCSPNRMIKPPAIHVSGFLYSFISCPTLVAAAPSMTKTTVNPRINIREFNSTVLNNLRSLDFNSSTLAPEIKDTYPGTNGSTQGERNEAIPARNAAIGKGKEDMSPCLLSDLHIVIFLQLFHITQGSAVVAQFESKSRCWRSS